jgi:hypothetical protein
MLAVVSFEIHTKLIAIWISLFTRINFNGMLQFDRMLFAYPDIISSIISGIETSYFHSSGR